MLLKVDASKLEWVVKVWRSQDPVAMKEIVSGFDIHTDNQTIFKLPNRTIAKNFVYQMIFADAFGDRGFMGPAYSYSKNANYMEASSSPEFWCQVITKFFDKYQGIYDHSVSMIKEAVENGRIVSPSGRFYEFSQVLKYGSIDWPRADILNYPIQGLAADFVQLVRIYVFDLLSQFREWEEGKILLINTVHDDIELDVDNDPELVYNICIVLIKAFEEAPKLFEKTYGVVVNVPMTAEVDFGPSLYKKQMVKFNPETFHKDWRNLNHGK